MQPEHAVADYAVLASQYRNMNGKSSDHPGGRLGAERSVPRAEAQVDSPRAGSMPDVRQRHGERSTEAFMGQGMMSFGVGQIRWGWAAVSLRSPAARGCGRCRADKTHPAAAPTVAEADGLAESAGRRSSPIGAQGLARSPPCQKKVPKDSGDDRGRARPPANATCWMVTGKRLEARSGIEGVSEGMDDRAGRCGTTEPMEDLLDRLGSNDGPHHPGRERS